MRKNAKQRGGFSRTSLKAVAMIVAIAVVMCTSIGGTYAWMMAKTEPVVNTFTFGNIGLTLTESPSQTDDGDANANTNTYGLLMPGEAISKDPTVTVTAGSEACWLFVKLEEKNDFDTYLQYTLTTDWTALEGETDVYYMAWPKADPAPTEDDVIPVLLDNKVYVKADVTEQMIKNLDNTGLYPSLAITAYAVQRNDATTEVATPEAAWQLVEAENVTE